MDYVQVQDFNLQYSGPTTITDNSLYNHLLWCCDNVPVKLQKAKMLPFSSQWMWQLNILHSWHGKPLTWQTVPWLEPVSFSSLQRTPWNKHKITIRLSNRNISSISNQWRSNAGWKAEENRKQVIVDGKDVLFQYAPSLNKIRELNTWSPIHSVWTLYTCPAVQNLSISTLSAQYIAIHNSLWHGI